MGGAVYRGEASVATGQILDIPPSPASLPGSQLPQGQLLQDEEESGQEVRWPQPQRLPWKANGGSPPRAACGLCPPSQGAGGGQRWHGSTATAWFGSAHCPGPAQLQRKSRHGASETAIPFNVPTWAGPSLEPIPDPCPTLGSRPDSAARKRTGSWRPLGTGWHTRACPR